LFYFHTLCVMGLLRLAGYLRPYLGEGYVSFVEVYLVNVKPLLSFGRNSIAPDARLSSGLCQV